MTSHIQRLRRIAVVSLLVLAGLAATATSAFATHFRYGTITWQITDPTHPNIVTIRFDSAFRWSFPWGGTSTCPVGFVATGGTGAGSCPAINSVVSPGSITITGPGYSKTIPISLTVTSVNSVEDWFTGSFTTDVTFPVTGVNPAFYTASFANSARLSSLAEGNNDQAWNVATGITVPATGGAINQPPTSSTLPIIYLARNQTTTFGLPVSDPNGDIPTFRFSTAAESSLVTTIPGATQSNPMTITAAGVIQWTPHTDGLYSAQFHVQDPAGAYTVIDLLFRVQVAINPPPTVLVNGFSTPQTFTGTAGVPIGFPVSASSNPAGGTLLLSAGAVPVGSTMSPGLPISAVAASSFFNWNVPVPGTYVLNFSALDIAGGSQGSNSIAITVNKAGSTTGVLSSPNPNTFGQSVTVTAVVNPASGTVNPTGTVQFQIDNVNTGSPVAISSHSASTTLLMPSAGTHTITAVYPGDANLAGSSGSATQNVNKANTQIVFSPPPSAISVGQFPSLGVRVTPVFFGSSPAPSGTVQFFEGATLLCTSFAPLDANGFAGCNAPVGLTGGTHTISAVYNGDAGYNGSSTTASQVVNPINSTTSVTSSQSPSSPFGQTLTFTATVNGAPLVSRTGTVQFLIDNVNAGSPVTLVNSVATFSTSALSVATHSITAKYSGDSSYNLSQGSISQTVNPASPTITVTSDINPVTFGNTVTFTATVSSIGGPGTGTVTFSAGSAVLSSPITLSGAGTATFATDALNLGTFSINASFVSANPNVLNGLGTKQQTVIAGATPPFSQPFPTPPGACICTPTVMNTTGLGSQLWHAQAGGTSMTITAYAVAVNNVDPETVLLRVFTTAGVQVGSDVTASYPAGTPQGTEVGSAITFATTPGTVYRVVVSTPGAAPTQPHYRLKFEGASEAAMSPINSLESVSDAQRWLFNVNAGEALGVRLFPSSFLTGATATNLTVQVFDTANPGVPVPVLDAASNPVTTLNLTGPATFPFTINFATPPSASSVYMVAVESANGHYRIARLSGADTGIYLSWFTAGEGTVNFNVHAPGSFGASTVQMNVTSTFEGNAVGSFQLPAGTTSLGKANTGRYHIEFVAPAGYFVTPAFVDVDILCDLQNDITLTVTAAATTTSINAPTITYGHDGVVTVSVASADGAVPGSVDLIVDGGAPLTQALTAGSATFTVPGLNAGDHSLDASYTPQGGYQPRHRRINSTTRSGVLAGRRVQSGSRVSTAAIESLTVPPSKRRMPVSISKNTTPNAQLSARLSTGFPRACSGLM